MSKNKNVDNIILQKKSAQIRNLKNPDLDLFRRIHPGCGFMNSKSVFGFRNPDLDFPQKKSPLSPRFPCIKSSENPVNRSHYVIPLVKCSKKAKKCKFVW